MIYTLLTRCKTDDTVSVIRINPERVEYIEEYKDRTIIHFGSGKNIVVQEPLAYVTEMIAEGRLNDGSQKYNY